MIEYTKCPDCFANYMGDHTCDPLMKFLVSEYKNKIEKNKIDMMKTQHEAGGECICEAIFHENIKTASPKCTLHGNSAMKDERYKDFGDALAFSLSVKKQSSGEVKETWEEFEQNFPTKIQVIEKGIYEDSWRFTSYFKDTFSKFIRTQRSLAQQEILDRVAEEVDYIQEKIYACEWREHQDFTTGQRTVTNLLKNVLSTLKDTNI